MTARVPMLVLGDAPSGQTGLARIHRELGQRIVADLPDVFRVGSLGFGSGPSRSLPWEQWQIKNVRNWAVEDLPGVWQEFAGDERGIVFVISNPSWHEWLVRPELCQSPRLREFVERRPRPFETWIYAPIDGVGVGDWLPLSIAATLSKFDRILAYTEWAARLIDPSTPFLPHGIDRSVFFPYDKVEARKRFMQTVVGHPATVPPLRDGLRLLGVVATNSERKDWPLAFDTLRELVRRGKQDWAMWIHTNAMRKHWDLPALADAFRVTDRVVATTGRLSDAQMAVGYEACDVTLGIGAGEGWGLPLAESLACGTPVIHGNYAAGAEFVPERLLVDPIAFRYDGFYAIRRPVFRAADWADKVEAAMRKDESNSAMLHWPQDKKALLPEYIYWDKCWEGWREWLLEGVEK
jgi:glycosyltransferase involved in cell wall biosynthesis